MSLSKPVRRLGSEVPAQTGERVKSESNRTILTKPTKTKTKPNQPRITTQSHPNHRRVHGPSTPPTGSVGGEHRLAGRPPGDRERQAGHRAAPGPLGGDFGVSKRDLQTDLFLQNELLLLFRVGWRPSSLVGCFDSSSLSSFDFRVASRWFNTSNVPSWRGRILRWTKAAHDFIPVWPPRKARCRACGRGGRSR